MYEVNSYYDCMEQLGGALRMAGRWCERARQQRDGDSLAVLAKHIELLERMAAAAEAQQLQLEVA